MRSATASVLTPLLRLLDAETAHGLALRALSAGLAGADSRSDDPVLATTAFGLTFANPLGLAAGFDKDAVAAVPLLRLGFGHVELGTVTPRPQPGNPKPRLFRFPRQRAIINRMGFNNAGIEAYCARLAVLPPHSGCIGANLGINKDNADPERDYPALVAAVAPYADYITINISSPNTPGLRDLQAGPRLRGILQAISTRVPARPPLLVKLAPDLSDQDLAAIVETALACAVDGLIISNTTIARPPGLTGPHVRETGGLSGPPVFARSTAMLRTAYRLSAGKLTLIGCGGIRTGDEALAKIRAGATLVQIYTAFAYEGPTIVPRLKQQLATALRRDGFVTLAHAVGADVS